MHYIFWYSSCHSSCAWIMIVTVWCIHLQITFKCGFQIDYGWIFNSNCCFEASEVISHEVATIAIDNPNLPWILTKPWLLHLLWNDITTFSIHVVQFELIDYCFNADHGIEFILKCSTLADYGPMRLAVFLFHGVLVGFGLVVQQGSVCWQRSQ